MGRKSRSSLWLDVVEITGCHTADFAGNNGGVPMYGTISALRNEA